MSPHPPASQVIGKYRLIAPIGRGGMAHVHLACLEGPLGFHKLFVIKRLREDVDSGESDPLAMFLDEARLSARLNHPNIVQTVDVGEADGRYFIAMEFLEGQSLRAVERRLTPQAFPLSHALRVLSETAKALHYAHQLCGYDGEPLQIVHRDVSPQNVFVTYDGQVKLLDFGIAKAESSSHLTQIGIIKGKADYMAPEQMRGEPLDRRADIFALGVMLYEVLAQQRFSGGSKVAEAAKMHARITGAEPRLRQVRPNVPEELAVICERAIALDPARRYATAQEFAAALDAQLERFEPRPTAESFAALMQRAFRDERTQLRRVIDERMMQTTEATNSAMRAHGNRSSLLPLPQGGGSTPPSRPSLLALPGEQPSARPAPVSGVPTRMRVMGLAAAVLMAASVVFALTLALGGDADVTLPKPVAKAKAPVNEPAAPREARPAARVQHVAALSPQRREERVQRAAKGSLERERPSRRVREAEAAPSPAPEPVETPAPHREEFEPGNDIGSLAPARGKPVDLELEEDPYE